MLGLSQSTEVIRPLLKAQHYKRFDWEPSQRDSFDGEVSRLDFINWIAPRTLPAIAEGAEVKEIFIIEVSLKSRNFDTKSIVLLAKIIPQRVIYLLRFEDGALLAVYHTKLFTTTWQSLDSISVPLYGLTLDVVWQNIVAFVGKLEVADGNSLTDQIQDDEGRNAISRQINSLEQQMRASSQPYSQRKFYSEIKKLKESCK